METFRRGDLTFEVTDSGPDGGPVAILLHGFPEDRHSWSEVGDAVSGAGWRVLAPDQRGYSPGARPSRRRDYRVEELEGDILALADSAGAERFDVVGHDWGAVVAWSLAANHPRRVRSVAGLSVPHSGAFLASMGHSTQALHSWYMLMFQLPALPERLMAVGGGRRMAGALTRSGLPEEAARRYSQRGGEPGAMRGPINWYRALPWGVRRPAGKVEVPAMFVYGDGDPFITRAAADRCGDWCRGPYRYEVLTGADHWLPEGRPTDVARLLVEHLGSAT